MNPQVARCWLHRFALLTAIMTLLLPVTTGALVTTLKAGMAFEDWPSSDGHFILTYPWIGSARDQFVEHGHRLSGMTIGLLSIALAGLSLSLPTDRTSKFLGVLILVMVIVQGMLGGVRVLLDRETLALIHGDFAAAVFSVMSVLVMVTSNRWNDFAVKTVAGSFSEPSGQSVSPDFLKTVTNDGRSIVRLIGGLTFLSIAFQYFLGGLLRHLRVGWAWWLHPWFALVPLVLAVAFYVAVMRSRLDLAGIKRLASV
ncbi:MAG: hypothetical protein FJ267_07260, partial [Planctomycetes bacterium]|nr:hypothetical protein [Planctomycetota bacterium]